MEYPFYLSDYQDKPSSDTLTYDGICPLIPPPFSIGACVDQCSSDSECLDGLKCCNTGCGHMCLEAEAPRPKFACPIPTESPFGLCVDVCTFESDCKPHERCCSNGCGHVCMSAQEVSLAMTSFKTKASIRPGYCPAEKSIRYIECSEKEQCTKDSDCFGIRKCCFSEQCGYICSNPRKKKPGYCRPPTLGFGGICISRCNDDSQCPGLQKCCSNGCGRTCQNVLHQQIEVKPGSCPVIIRRRSGRCGRPCSSDSDCSGSQKCCESGGCGRLCRNPVNGPGICPFWNPNCNLLQ
ncbi:hypothetical protein LOTGIDRAFT_106601 [Lottia gigantea]|uniref:WAP domain-containing protein n=1 Tax=Lottia gigantea TaxID=225164 RepID=V3ZX24_LOTGI|nr:hypothetical protein LOTGIDRAFT_106601 [Lottia gigantea]ESO88912.1 hypothetical protein LOTGIDRAFT_106601 [Lottia gigantea]